MRKLKTIRQYDSELFPGQNFIDRILNKEVTYDEIRTRIIVRLYPQNAVELEHLYHTQFLDMAAAYFICDSDKPDRIVSHPTVGIFYGLFETLNVSAEQLHEDAVRNTYRMFPYRLFTAEENGMEPLGNRKPNIPFTISNGYNAFTASLITSTAVMDSLCTKAKSDLAVFVWTDDSVILCPTCTKDFDGVLNRMMISADYIKKSEKHDSPLSSKIWIYSRSEHRFTDAGITLGMQNLNRS